MDGPVSYCLEWNGLKFVFGGDTFPNKWYVKYAKGADLAIHECFPSPPMLMKYEHLSAQSALNVAIKVHTVPQTFGLVMDVVKPRSDQIIKLQRGRWSNSFKEVRPPSRTVA